MAFPFARSQKSAHRMIARWGGGQNNGKLVRASGSRTATMAMLEYTPKERGLFSDGSVRIYVSALNLKVGPDEQLDTIEFRGKTYRILLPPVGPRPNGLVVMYYDCNCIEFTAEG